MTLQLVVLNYFGTAVLLIVTLQFNFWHKTKHGPMSFLDIVLATHDAFFSVLSGSVLVDTALAEQTSALLALHWLIHNLKTDATTDQVVNVLEFFFSNLFNCRKSPRKFLLGIIWRSGTWNHFSFKLRYIVNFRSDNHWYYLSIQ